MADPEGDREPAAARAFFRLEVRVPCRLTEPDRQALTGYTVDLSAGGLRVDLGRRGARLCGERVEVRLLAPGRLPPEPMLAHVVDRGRLVRLRFEIEEARRAALLAALLRIQGRRLR